MILLLDNYDSFVYNLDRYVRQLNVETLVVRSNAIDVPTIARLNCRGIIISPGPKTPDKAGCSLEVVRRLGDQIPILGVCLGHQAIGQALGSTIVRASQPMHGISSMVYRSSDLTVEGKARSKILDGLPDPFSAGRYHSLVIDPTMLPDCLVKTAWTDDGCIMAVEHRTWPLFGVQFHPESILTEQGHRIIANFIDICYGTKTKALPTSDMLNLNG